MENGEWKIAATLQFTLAHPTVYISYGDIAMRRRLNHSVHSPSSIIPKKRTAPRSIQAERCNFIAFLSNLRSKHLIAIIGEGVDQALGVVNAADLTDDMDNRLADLEVRLYAVMLEQDDIGILLCNDVREVLERTRCIRHEHRAVSYTHLTLPTT